MQHHFQLLPAQTSRLKCNTRVLHYRLETIQHRRLFILCNSMRCDSFLLYHVTNASNIVSFLLVKHEYLRLNLPEHDFPAILFHLHLRHLISPFNSPLSSRNSTVLIICKEIKNNLHSTPPCPKRLHLMNSWVYIN